MELNDDSKVDAFQPYKVRVILSRNSSEVYIDERIVKACNQQGKLAELKQQNGSDAVF